MKHYILFLLLASTFWCCSNDEDVVPSNNDRNMFDMPDFSSEEEMKVRRFLMIRYIIVILPLLQGQIRNA